MIDILLNGESKSFQEATTIAQLLSSLKIDEKNIAVAINFTVVARSEFTNKTIKNGDTVDILHPTAGG